MGLRYWTGYSWRRISEAEARLRRARGQDVVDSELPPPDPPKPPDPLPVLSLDEVLPPAPAELSDDELERLTDPNRP